MKNILPALKLFVVLALLTGLIYPTILTVVAEVAFRSQAEGSQHVIDGKLVGSDLLAQKFESPKYFWPRPSADDFGTVASGASNLGPTTDSLKSAINDRVNKIRETYHLEPDGPIPDDLLTTSGSGLDPHISPEAARLQVSRIAAARNFTDAQKAQLTSLVNKSIEPPQLGLLGQARVNVLLLNLAVDQLR